MTHATESKNARRKVLLIGWDAADWKVITPLMDAGKMPNLQKLVDGGVIGNLATLYPPLSPMLWTSIATGKRPYKHGIYGFSEPTPDGKSIRPITNLSRHCRALWNILQLKGLKSNVVGWWPSHPAEPIDGVMVSDMFQKNMGRLDAAEDKDAPAPHLEGDDALDAIHTRWPVRPNSIHPPELVKHLRDLRIHPQELTAAEIGMFVPELAKVDQAKDHRLESIAKVICECTSVHAVATGILQTEPWDLMAVYYDAIDHFCHGFMKFHPPRLPWIDEADFEIYKNVVESGYRYHDMMLGTLMQLAGDDTTIMLISDHGFHPDHNRPASVANEPAGPAEEHSHYGVVVLHGPGIKKDERIYGSNLLDVTPTVLHAMGLPVGEDMDGKVLINAFDGDAPIETIPTWEDVPGEDGMHPKDMVMDSLESKEALDQLVALGYIEKPDENVEVAVRQTVRELEYNLARSYMDAGLYLKGSEILEKLLAEFPDEYRFGTQLIGCYQSLGQLEKIEPLIDILQERKEVNAAQAKEELEAYIKEHGDDEGKLDHENMDEKEQKRLRKLRAEAGTNQAAFHVLRGNLYTAKEDFAAAREAYTQAVKLGQMAVLTALGNASLRVDELEEAEQCFAKALQRNPNDATAHLGFARLNLKKKQYEPAIEAALNSVGLLYHQPRAHYVLARALRGNKQIPRAIEALKVATLQNPNFPEALEMLAHLYDGPLKQPTEAEQYKRKASEARDTLAKIKSGEITADDGDVEVMADSAISSDMNVLEMSAAEIADRKAPLEKTVTIVTGLPRSGTSMMMQMLDAGGMDVLSDGKRTADEDNPKGYYEFTPAMQLQRNRSWVAEEGVGHVVKIVAQLLWYLPRDEAINYRVVFMDRDIAEVLASQEKMLDRAGRPDAHGRSRNIRDTFTKQITQVFRFLNARRIPTLSVDYHECVGNPTKVAAEINEFFDGQLDAEAMAAVVDPSLYRNRRK